MVARQIATIRVILICGALLQGAGAATAGTVLFWADEHGVIGRANSDGSNKTAFLHVNVPPQGIAVGPDGTIYWGDYRTDSIHITNADGTPRAVFPTGAGEPRGVAVDAQRGKLYWAIWGNGYTRIQRSNLDGTAIESLLVSYGGPGEMKTACGVAIDATRRTLYWADPEGGCIWTAGLDGSGPKALIDGLTWPFMLDIDERGGWFYWSAVTRIQRARLDGSQIEDVVTGLVQARGVAIDDTNDQLFIVDNGAHSVLRANLDGSDLRVIIRGLGFPSGIAVLNTAVVPEPASLFTWAAMCTAIALQLLTVYRRVGGLSVGVKTDRLSERR